LETKKEIREFIKRKLKDTSIEELLQMSDEIIRKVEISPVFITSHRIMMYWSMPGEIHTHDFIRKWYRKKEIFLPRIDDNKIVPVRYTGDENLYPTPPFGILEPTGESYTGTLDLIIVPGLAFDEMKNRLGRGKSYYDRFLSETSGYKIGICFPFQLLPIIPADSWDVEMDNVIC